jgi:O-antigen/teichoic acid export membrane protein
MESPDNKRSPIAAGLIVSWVAQFMQIASGFLIPRLIDSGMGPTTLGIWDLCWSLATYLGLVKVGIGTSTSRYIAIERSNGTLDGINRIVSSAALIQRSLGSSIIIVCLLIWAIPYELPGVGADLNLEARWLILLLGSSVGLGMIDAVYTGVLTGCHRWTAHYAIQAVTYVLSVLGMVVVLSLGQGILALGIIHLLCELLGRLLRRIFAFRTCPGLKVSINLVDRKSIRNMIGFGGRMAVGKISQVILTQTPSILIAAYLGPAALAMFVRPRSLTRQAAVFPQKYSYMLVPTVAGLSGQDRQQETREFVTSSARTGIYISLPIITFLLVDGAPLVEIWMGHAYANPTLITLITLGLASEIIYQPIDNLLIGLNLHGRPALVMLAAALAAVILTWLALAAGLGLLGVAAAIGLPWTIAHGVYLPLYACKRLALRPLTFFRSIWAGPLAQAIPLAAMLAGGRALFPWQPALALSSGAIVGGVYLMLTYWLWVIPENVKSHILSKIRSGWAPTKEFNRSKAAS